MTAITLYQIPGDHGLSASPYCNKVHWALRLKGLVYRTEDRLRAGAVSASGKLPMLVYDAARVYDSTVILRFLEARHPHPALVPAAPAQAALAHVLEEWADEAWIPYGRYYRWVDAAGFAASVATLGRGFPPRLAAAVLAPRRRRLARELRPLVAAGVQAGLERHLDALAALLGHGDWLAGDAPSVADIAVAAQVHSLRGPGTPEPARWIAARPAITAWLARFLARAARVEWPAQ